MAQAVKVLDVVALTADIPEHGLVQGEVGTAVEELEPGVFEIEFSDDQGRAYKMIPVAQDRLLVLRYRSTEAA